MARPKRTDDKFATRDQLISRFQELATRMPLDQISVRLLVDSVGCNKTTFYYHFETLESLCDTALGAMGIDGSARLVVRRMMGEGREAQPIADDLQLAQSLDRLCAFALLNESGRGRAYLNGLLTQATAEALDVDPDAAGNRARTLLAFAAGGVGEALRLRGSTGNSIPAGEFIRTVRDVVMPAIRRNLRSAQGDDGSLPAWLR